EATPLTDTSLRSHATTSWLCRMRRRVMFAPMRPSPTIPIFNGPIRSSRDLLQVVDFDAQRTAAVRFEALEIADGLGVDERAEVVRLSGDFDVSRRGAWGDLDGHHLVGAAFVELAGGVKEPGPVPGGDRHAAQPVAHRPAQAFESVVLTEGQVGLERDVIAGSHRLLDPPR